MHLVETGGDILFPIMEESLLELAIKNCGCCGLFSGDGVVGVKGFVLYCVMIESPGTTTSSAFEYSSAT